MDKRQQNGVDRGWHALASIETASTFEDLRLALTDSAQPSAFEWVCLDVAPGATPLYELRVATDDPTTASCTGRSLLSQLTDAADRGMLTHFRIVSGAHLLAHPARKDETPELDSGHSSGCDETSRAAQPDIAIGTRRWPPD